MSFLSNLRGELADIYRQLPQKSLMASFAINSIEAGIAALAAMGHPVQLQSGADAGPPEEYPKMVYSATKPPYHMTVASKAEEDTALGEGWSLNQSPAEAALNPPALAPATILTAKKGA